MNRKRTHPRKRPATFWALFYLLVLQGISATPPGALLVFDPSGKLLQIPLTTLSESPFSDFLIPGLILCFGLGLGAFLVAAAIFFLPELPLAERINPIRGKHWSWATAIAFGVALMVWIIVQVVMIGAGSWLQPFYFGVGLAVILLSLTSSVRVYMDSK